MRFLASAFLFAAAPAFAGHHPYQPGFESRENPSNVSYYGGPVISHVKTYIIYWGAGVTPELQGKLTAFYSATVNSTYLDQLAEFGTNVRAVDGRMGTQQEIGRGTVGGSFTIQPVNTSKSLDQAAIEAELEAQISRGALPKPDADSYYALHFPDGYSISISFGLGCSSWYADHEVYKSKNFGNVFYAMFPCDSSDTSNFHQLTFAASHELIEAVSDPMSPLSGEQNAFPAGWLRADGEEIGDLCTGASGTLIAGSEHYNVNPPWLNSAGHCGGGDYHTP